MGLSLMGTFMQAFVWPRLLYPLLSISHFLIKITNNRQVRVSIPSDEWPTLNNQLELNAPWSKSIFEWTWVTCLPPTKPMQRDN